MELARNTRVVLASPFGAVTDAYGALIRNGSHGYIRSEIADGRLVVAFPGVRVEGSYQRATLTAVIAEWWMHEATAAEVERFNSPSPF